MLRSRLVALGGLCALLGGCVDDAVSIRIECIIPPSDDCTYPAEPELCSGEGALNLSVANVYYANYQVANGLRARMRASPPLAETMGFNVDGFDVTLRDAAGNKLNLGSLANPYFVQATGYAEPAGSTPSGGVMIPSTYVAQIARRASTTSSFTSIQIEVRVRATTDSDRKLKSTAITYPIHLGSASDVPDDGQCTVKEDTVCLLGQDADAYACNPALVME